MRHPNRRTPRQTMMRRARITACLTAVPSAFLAMHIHAAGTDAAPPFVATMAIVIVAMLAVVVCFVILGRQMPAAVAPTPRRIVQPPPRWVPMPDLPPRAERADVALPPAVVMLDEAAGGSATPVIIDFAELNSQ